MDIKPVLQLLPRPRANAEPLHIQRLEAALNMRPFMDMTKRALRRPLSSNEDSSEEREIKREPTEAEDSDDFSTVGVVKQRCSSKSKHRLLGSKEGKWLPEKGEMGNEWMGNISGFQSGKV